MKSLIIVLVLLTPVLLQAQGNFQAFTITEVDSSSLEAIYVTGTETATSDYFLNWPSLAFNIFVDDTSSGGDSSAIEFKLYKCTSLVLLDWVVEDSLTFSTDSTWTSWLYCEEKRLPFQYCKFECVGQAGNKKLSATKAIIRRAVWHTSKR